MATNPVIPFKAGQFSITNPVTRQQELKTFPQGAEAGNNGPVGMLQSNLVCPLCDMKRILANEPPLEEHCISTRAGSFESSCAAGHPWPDLTALKAAGARTVERKFRPIFRPPEAIGPTVTMKFNVPEYVSKRITARFPENLEASVVSLMDCMADPGSFVIPAREATTLNDKAGERITNFNELLGWAAAIVVERNELRDKVKAAESGLAAPAAADLEKAGIQLSSSVVSQIAERATRSEVPVNVYIDNLLNHAISNGWLD